MKEGKASEAKSGNKGLVILLCALVVVIVGLGIGIVVVVNGNDNDSSLFDGEVNDSVSALEANDVILNKMNNNLEYSIEEAVEEFENEMNVGDDSRKVYIAIYYADFVYSYYGNIDQSVAILGRVENLVIDDDMAINYYVALRDLYLRAGMEEEVVFYNQKVVDLIPEDTRSVEELKGEEIYEEDLL